VLDGVERETARESQSSRLSPVPGGIHGQRAIFQDKCPLRVGDGGDAVHLAGQSQIVDRHHGGEWPVHRFQLYGVHIAGCGVDIDEDRFRALQLDRVRRRDMGHRGDGDAVAWTDTLYEQCQMQPCRAARHSNRVLGTDAFGESLLESGRDFAMDQHAAFQDLTHSIECGLIQLGPAKGNGRRAQRFTSLHDMLRDVSNSYATAKYRGIHGTIPQTACILRQNGF